MTEAPPDRTPLTKAEALHAMRVRKWVTDPTRRLASGPARTEEVVDVFHADPLLTSKGVQLVLEFTVNAGLQLRHRFRDAARRQVIAQFHLEDNHKEGPNGPRVPHMYIGHGRYEREAGLWPVSPTISFDESKVALMAFLEIENRVRKRASG